MQPMYYIGLDVHKQKISRCAKDSSGKIYAGGWIPATRFDLDRWMKALPKLATPSGRPPASCRVGAESTEEVSTSSMFSTVAFLNSPNVMKVFANELGQL
jgi:hypothetical protein